MFRNYLKIAFRNLKKNKLQTFINISGLAIGIAVTILILSYVWFELSFDRFHSKSDRIYRLVKTTNLWGDGARQNTSASLGPELATVLKENYPEINHIARLFVHRNQYIIPSPDFIYVDNDIFKIFDIELIHGDSETALLNPNSIVLTEEESINIFGDENPVGRSFDVDLPAESYKSVTFTITGVAKSMPQNSHFSFRYLLPFNEKLFSDLTYIWGGSIYLTLSSDYPPENLVNKFPEIVDKYFPPDIQESKGTSYENWLKSGGVFKLSLQPLKKIHLGWEVGEVNILPIKKENPVRIRMYSAIALLIIFLACINFISLSTAKSGERAKEVGVRKVSGAKKSQLIFQFLTESILLSIVSLLIAFILVAIFSRHFYNLLDIHTSPRIAGILSVFTIFFTVTLIVGLLAGSYPAFILTAFKPVNVLKGKISGKTKGITLRDCLVVFQFIVSVILIVSSIIIYKQFSYMQNKDLGFNRDNIVIIRRSWRLNSSSGAGEVGLNRYKTFRQELLNNPRVICASYSSTFPGRLTGYNPRMNVRPEGSSPGTEYNVVSTGIDPSFKDVYGLEIAEGNIFKDESKIPVTSRGVILNESAVNLLGLKDPLGKYIYENYGNNNKYPIIGIFKDHHNIELYNKIRPTIYIHKLSVSYLSVRFVPGNMIENIAFLEETWKRFVPDRSFEYSFFDKEFEKLYKKEKKLSLIFTFFAILAIFIACLGIFGLAALTAERRTKEIGIRKAMGASIINIVEMLSKIYLKLILVALLFACPIGYLIMNKWLQNFAYHTRIGVLVFIFTVLIILFIVLSSVSYYSIKAALTNPARTLKYE